MDYVKKRKFPKKESDFIKSFMDELKIQCIKHQELSSFVRDEPFWHFKTHGEPMQVRGIPDILMCFCGLFIGMEFKIMRNCKLLPTPYQEYNLDLIEKSMGSGLIVWYDENNQNCGINMQRFETMKICVTNLIDFLIKFTKIPPCKYKDIKSL